MRWNPVGVCLVLIFLIVGPAAARSTTKMDIYFYKYARQYFDTSVDWRWFKAQGMAESNLDPEALSPVGARGVMQIMPGTWKEICYKKKIIADITDARWNIAAGVYYDSYLWGQWRSKRTKSDRLALTFASYNAGLGTILKAQQLCIADGKKDCNTWEGVCRYNHNRWRREETTGYVKHIFDFLFQLKPSIRKKLEEGIYIKTIEF